jgi:ABC-type branched-subunit amino acid transport system ATPase component
VVSLAYGQQRLAELARALVCEPARCCWGRACRGLNMWETEDLAGTISRINATGLTVFVEHDMGLVMNIFDEIRCSPAASPRSRAPSSVIRRVRIYQARTLKVRNLEAGYGPLKVSPRSPPRFGGEIVTLIGANGAGKSTLLRAPPV